MRRISFFIWIILEILSIALVVHFCGKLNAFILWLLIAILGIITLLGPESKILRSYRAGKKDIPLPVLMNAALTLLAGALLIFPGFLGDLLAGLILIPPIKRRVLAQILQRAKKTK